MKSLGPRARYRALLAAALSALAAGCLLPPPVDEADPETNRQPTIAPAFPLPLEAVTLSCSSPTPFFANLNDPDVNDTLYWRLFIDYYRADADYLESTTVTPLPPDRGNARAVTFSISSTDAILQERPDEVHFVELFVADRRFDDAAGSLDNDTLARIPISPGLTASYDWTINPINCP